jgi:hypothetical protein
MISSTALSTSPGTAISVPPGARKLIIHNPAVNALIIAVKLDYSATTLTFANGIQIPIGGTLILDLDTGVCPVQVIGIAPSGTPQMNVQILGAGNF